MILAVAVVLALGVWSGRQNTLSLLRDKSQATIEIQVDRIHELLRPIEGQLEYLAQQIEHGGIATAEDDGPLAHRFAGAVAATPHLRSLAFLTMNQDMLVVWRRDAGPELAVSDAGSPALSQVLADGRDRRGVFWGELANIGPGIPTLINARRPIFIADRYAGLLAATVEVGQLSVELEEAAINIGGNAFLLYGKDRVLAHRDIATGIAVPADRETLPSVAALGDRVLKAYLGQGQSVWGRRTIDKAVGIRTIAVDGQDYAVLTATLEDYGVEPWLVGLYLPAAALADEISRLRWAGFAGFVVLVIALVVTWRMSRHLSRPLDRLARAAEQVTALRLDEVDRLPTGRLAEPARAANAFNAMVEALRWFEAYVPRRLVLRLLAEGSDAVATSAAREVTVLFTDIAGFTDQSERLRAEDTAAFLNAHFTILTDCVETESGTIDKFIGDSMMAFWGAPDEQPDHAIRACRAALVMREAVSADNATRKERGLPPVRVRIGLHTGEVVVGNIGTPGRLNYTIVGDVVNAASRLEQLGREQERDVAICISGATLAAAGGSIHGVALGQHKLRGRREEISVYAL